MAEPIARIQCDLTILSLFIEPTEAVEPVYYAKGGNGPHATTGAYDYLHDLYRRSLPVDVVTAGLNAFFEQKPLSTRGVQLQEAKIGFCAFDFVTRDEWKKILPEGCVINPYDQTEPKPKFYGNQLVVVRIDPQQKAGERVRTIEIGRYLIELADFLCAYDLTSQKKRKPAARAQRKREQRPAP